MKDSRTTANTSPEQAGGPAYEPPRILSHSAEHLEGMTIDVNACTSAFGARRSDDDKSSGDDAVTY